MAEKLTPEQVARLDPFGVRKIPASEELKALLEEPVEEAIQYELAGPLPELKPPWKSGETILHYEGECRWWKPSPQGIIIQKGEQHKEDHQLLLNGREVLYQGACEEWWPHPQGVIIRKGTQLFLNGREFLYEQRDFYYYNYKVSPQGLIIEKKDQLLLDGKRLLFKGELKRPRDWEPHPRGGVVIRKGNRLLLNGEKLFYEGKWDRWEPSPQGVIIQKDNQLLLNGQELLYEGEWASWCPSYRGVIIRIRKNNQESQFLLSNGRELLKELLYEGEVKDYREHLEGYGIIIHQGNDWIFYG